MNWGTNQSIIKSMHARAPEWVIFRYLINYSWVPTVNWETEVLSSPCVFVRVLAGILPPEWYSEMSGKVFLSSGKELPYYRVYACVLSASWSSTSRVIFRNVWQIFLSSDKELTNNGVHSCVLGSNWESKSKVIFRNIWHTIRKSGQWSEKMKYHRVNSCLLGR